MSCHVWFSYVWSRTNRSVTSVVAWPAGHCCTSPRRRSITAHLWPLTCSAAQYNGRRMTRVLRYSLTMQAPGVCMMRRSLPLETQPLCYSYTFLLFARGIPDVICSQVLYFGERTSSVRRWTTVDIVQQQDNGSENRVKIANHANTGYRYQGNCRLSIRKPTW